MDEDGAKPKNEKLKNDTAHTSRLLFLTLWIAGYAAAWLLLLLTGRSLTMRGLYFNNDIAQDLLIALGTGIPTAFVQALTMQHVLRWSLRWWLPVSIMAWALGGLAWYLVWSCRCTFSLLAPLDYTIFQRLTYLPLFVPVALVQWLFLRRRVRAAGLWVIAALTGAVLFTLPDGQFMLVFRNNFSPQYEMAALAAVLYSSVTGIAMLYLWTQQRSSEKSKNTVSASDAERLQRLNGMSEASIPSDLSQTRDKMKLSR